MANVWDEALRNIGGAFEDLGNSAVGQSAPGAFAKGVAWTVWDEFAGEGAWHKEQMGRGAYGLAKAASVIPGVGESDDIRAFERGYTTRDGRTFSGGRAVWEHGVSDNPKAFQFVTEAVVNPFTALGGIGRAGAVTSAVGKSRAAIASAPAAVTAWKGVELAGRGVQRAAAIGQKPDLLIDKYVGLSGMAGGMAASAITGDVLGLVGGAAVGSIAGRTVVKPALSWGVHRTKNLGPIKHAFDFYQQTKAHQHKNGVINAWNNFWIREQAVQAGKNLAARTTMAQVGVLDPNAPAYIRYPKDMRGSAWKNTPPGQVASEAGNNALVRLYRKYAHNAQKTHFVNRSVANIKMAIPEGPDEWQALVDIGADIMLNTIPNGVGLQQRISGAVQWADELKVRAKAEMGVDLDDMILPGIYEKIRKQRPDLPHVRWTQRDALNWKVGDANETAKVEELTPQQLQEYVARWGAGRIVARYSADADEQAVADQFRRAGQAYYQRDPSSVKKNNPRIEALTDGRYADIEYNNHRPIAGKAFVDRALSGEADPDTGLRLHNFQEFKEEMQDEFGLEAMDDGAMMDLYTQALNRVQDFFVTAARGTQQAKGGKWKRAGAPMNLADMGRRVVEGDEGSDFYTAYILPLRQLMPDDNTFIQFMRLSSANSPQSKVPENAERALRRWVEYMATDGTQMLADEGVMGLDKFTNEQVAMLGRMELGIQGDLPNRQKNSFMALSGLELNGLKINDFTNASLYAAKQMAQELGYKLGSVITGRDRAPTREGVNVEIAESQGPAIGKKFTADEYAGFVRHSIDSYVKARGGSTMDVWHSRATRIPDNPGKNNYLVMRSAVQAAADELGVSTDELQAAVWAVERADPTYKGGGKEVSEGGRPIAQEYVERTGNRPIKDQQMMQEFVAKQLQTWRSNVRETIEIARKRNRPIERDMNFRDIRTAGEQRTPNLMSYANDESASAPKGEDWEVDVPKKKKKSDVEPPPAVREDTDGVVLHHLVIPDDDKAVRDIMWYKLMMQDALQSDIQDWYRFSFVVGKGEGNNLHVAMTYVPDSGIAKQRNERAYNVVTGYIDRELRLLGTDDVPTVSRELPRIMNRAREIEKNATHWTSNIGNLAERAAREIEELEDAILNGPERIAEIAAAGGRTAKSKVARIEGLRTGGSTMQVRRDGKKLDLVNIQPTAPIVGIASALAPDGTQNIGGLKGDALREAFREFFDRITPAVSADKGNLTVGTYRGDDGFTSLDFGIMARNEDEAEWIGAMTNQKEYWHPVRGESVPIRGGDHSGNSPFVTPEEITGFLETVYRMQDGDPKANMMTASGVISPAALQMSKMIDGVMRRLPAWKRVNNPPDVGAADLDVEVLTDSRRNYQPYLSDKENETLWDQGFEDGNYAGEAYGTVLRRLTNEAKEDRELLTLGGSTDFELMNDFDRISLEDAITKTTDAGAKEILQKWSDRGIDIRKTAPEVASAYMVEDEISRLSGAFDQKTRTTMDKVRRAWGEQALLSVRYHTANLAGGFMNAFIRSMGTGRLYGMPGLAEFLSSWKNLDEIQMGSALPGFKSGEILMKYGVGAPKQITKAGTRSMVGEGDPQLGKIASRLFGAKVGKATSKVINANFGFAAGMDITFRSSAFADHLDAYMSAATPRLEAKIRGAAEKQGIDLTGVSLLPTMEAGSLSGVNPGFLLGYYTNLGFSKGYAERVSRDAAEEINKGIDHAIKEVNKTHFSYENRNVDEWVKKVVPFHYYASRSARFYAEEAMRNPILIGHYVRLQHGLDDMERDPGLNGRQKGFVRLLSDFPTGFTLMMNPDAMFGVIRAFGLDTSVEPSGETELGHILRTMKQNGVGMYPWIDGMVNMMGVYGDTFEPDMLGIRHRALVGSIIQYANSQGLLGDLLGPTAPSPYATANVKARETVSRWMNAIGMPGWMTQPVIPKASSTSTILGASLDTIIENRILAENPGLTGEQLVAIMNDPESPEYQRAYQQAATAGVITQLLSFTAPFSIKARESSRDVRTAQMNVVREAAEKAGVLPQDYQPTAGDVEFHANYRNQTGQNFKIGDYTKASIQDKLAEATPEARPMIMWDFEYQSIGSPAARSKQRAYEAIRSGKQWPPNVTPPNSIDDFQRIADWWLKQNDPSGEVQMLQQQRRNYRAMHPQFDLYKTWQGQMFDLKTLHGNLGVYRQQAAEKNPNAKQYFEGQLRFFRDIKGLRGQELIDALDNSTTNENAYMAIVMGVQTSVFSSAAQPTASPNALPYEPSAQLIRDSSSPSANSVNWSDYLYTGKM